MKKFQVKFGLLTIVASTIIISFSSCSKDEPDNPQDLWPDIEDSSTTGSDINEKIEIVEALVKNNVTTSITYSNYHTHIRIEHTLSDIFPNQKIEFQIGHGERGNTDVQVISSNRNPVVPSISTLGSKTIVSMDYPFYYYYIYKAITADNSEDANYYNKIVASCEFDMETYKALIEMPNKSDSELSLLKDIVKIFNDYEKKAKGNYVVWVFVVVDNISIPVAFYNF